MCLIRNQVEQGLPQTRSAERRRVRTQAGTEEKAARLGQIWYPFVCAPVFLLEFAYSVSGESLKRPFPLESGLFFSHIRARSPKHTMNPSFWGMGTYHFSLLRLSGPTSRLFLATYSLPRNVFSGYTNNASFSR